MELPIQSGANLFIWIICILIGLVTALLFIDSMFGKNTILKKTDKKEEHPQQQQH